MKIRPTERENAMLCQYRRRFGCLGQLLAAMLLVFWIAPLPSYASDAGSSPSVQSETSASANGEISLLQEKIDVGSVPLLSRQKVVIPVLNSGNANLIIKDIRSSCGCTVVSAKQMMLGPGEEGVIEALWIVGGETGPKRNHIYILSNDRKKPEAAVEIIGTVYSEIEIFPQRIAIGNFTLSLPPLFGQF